MAVLIRDSAFASVSPDAMSLTSDDTSVVRLDPRIHQAAWGFLIAGFYRFLDGLDHLLFVFVLPAFTYFTTPLAAWWSRKHEFEADEFAAKFADARQLADALVKLYRDNATTLTPDSLHSAFYDSHPPALVRISRLQQLAART